MKSPAQVIGVLLTFVSLLCCSVTSASTHQNGDSAAIDSYILRQAHRERGEEYREARQVIVGDLTHDGQPETVVLYTIEGQGGGNLYIQYLAVFARRNGRLAPLTRIEVGGKSVRSVELKSVEDNSILLDTMSYGPKDPQCCPTVKGATKYVLSGHRLREEKHASRRPRVAERAATYRIDAGVRQESQIHCALLQHVR